MHNFHLIQGFHREVPLWGTSLWEERGIGKNGQCLSKLQIAGDIVTVCALYYLCTSTWVDACLVEPGGQHRRGVHSTDVCSYSCVIDIVQDCAENSSVFETCLILWVFKEHSGMIGCSFWKIINRVPKWAHVTILWEVKKTSWLLGKVEQKYCFFSSDASCIWAALFCLCFLNSILYVKPTSFFIVLLGQWIQGVCLAFSVSFFWGFIAFA